MGEPSVEYIKMLSKLFCDNYNVLNKSNYSFSGQENKQNDVDFYISDGIREIGIQHKRLESSENWYKSNVLSSNATDHIIDIGKRDGFKLHLYIKFFSEPKSEEEIQKLTRNLMIFLREHITDDGFKLKFAKDKDELRLANMFKYLSEVKLLSIGGSDFIVTIGNDKWGYGQTIDEKVCNLFNSIAAINNHYSKSSKDVILLIETDPMPVTGISLDELIKQCQKSDFHFSEIWFINLGNDGFCDKIWPSDIP